MFLVIEVPATALVGGRCLVGLAALVVVAVVVVLSVAFKVSVIVMGNIETVPPGKCL